MEQIGDRNDCVRIELHEDTLRKLFQAEQLNVSEIRCLSHSTKQAVKDILLRSLS